MTFYTRGEGNFYVQPDREARFQYLTCTGVGDIEFPEGDLTPVECQDALRSGDFVIEGFIRGTQGAGTYSLQKPLATVYNYLLERRCKYPARVGWAGRGSRQDPQNYSVALVMIGNEFSTRRIPNPVAMQGDDDGRVLTEADISFTMYYVIYKLTMSRITVANTSDALGVYMMSEQCADRDYEARDLCSYGLIGLDATGSIYDSEVKWTNNGSSWAEADAPPFASQGEAKGVLALDTATGPKWIAFRQESVAGQPAEASVSTDEGVSWTNVTIGSTNGQGINYWALAGGNIVVVATGGYIYVSTDFGASYGTMEDATETTEDLNDVDFYDADLGYAVGNSNVFLYTLNASRGADADWSSRTGPSAGNNLVSVAVNDIGHVYVGDSAGVLWRSTDRGQTWTQVQNFGAGTVDAVKFDDKGNYIGALLWNDATPVGKAYRSEDGGATWQEIPDMPTGNQGLNDLHICDENHIIVVGNVAADGTTFIAMTSPS